MESDIDIVEPAVAHQIGAAHELLFRGPTEHFERPLETETFHGAPRGERSADQHGGVDVMTFAMAGRAFNDELLRGYTRRLRIVRAAVVFCVNRDHWMARTIGG